MNILVPVRKVPDTTAKIAFTPDGKSFDANGVQFVMNPTDEWYALVRAVELKESLGGTVTLINIGGADNDQIIRKGLAIGGDDAVRIEGDDRDAHFCAKAISAYAKANAFDLIITGKEAIDDNGFQLAAMIAAFMDWPFISQATRLDVEGDVCHLSREIEGGHEDVEVSKPLVVSASKGMAEQRIPNMRGIMMARSKPLNVIQAEDSSVSSEVAKYALPPEKGDVKLIDADNIDELITLLKNEAKAI